MRVEDPTAVTSVRRDWAADEAARPGLATELARLVRRARRRWLRTLGSALLCAAIAVAVAWLLPQRPAARVVLRVRSGEPAAALRSDEALRAYVTAFAVAEADAAAGAGEALRRDLTVEVWRDRFAPPRSADDPARAARVALRLPGDDAQRVYDTVAQLGRRLAASPPTRARLRWELVDPGRVAPPGLRRATLLALVGLLAFVLALPWCAVGVGALDRHVYDLDDVRRLGLPTVGAVRRFDGDNAGALVSRLASDGARLGRS